MPEEPQKRQQPLRLPMGAIDHAEVASRMRGKVGAQRKGGGQGVQESGVGFDRRLAPLLSWLEVMLMLTVVQR